MALNTNVDIGKLIERFTNLSSLLPVKLQHRICDELVALHLKDKTVTAHRLLMRRIVQTLPLDFMVRIILGPLQEVPHLRLQVTKSLLYQACVVEILEFPPPHSVRQVHLRSTVRPTNFCVEHRHVRVEVRELHLHVKIYHDEFAGTSDEDKAPHVSEFAHRVTSITDDKIGYPNLEHLTIAMDERNFSEDHILPFSPQSPKSLIEWAVELVRPLKVNRTRVMHLNGHKDSKAGWSKWDANVGLDMTKKTATEIACLIDQMREDSAVWV